MSKKDQLLEAAIGAFGNSQYAEAGGILHQNQLKMKKSLYLPIECAQKQD